MSLRGLAEESRKASLEKTDKATSIKEFIIILLSGIAIGASAGCYISEYIRDRKAPCSLSDELAKENFSEWMKDKHPEDATKIGKAWSTYGMDWILHQAK